MCVGTRSTRDVSPVTPRAQSHRLLRRLPANCSVYIGIYEDDLRKRRYCLPINNERVLYAGGVIGDDDVRAIPTTVGLDAAVIMPQANLA